MSEENAELKAEVAEEMAAASESIHIDEEELADEKTWTEDVQMAGSDVLDFVKKVYQESTARRIIVKNKDGRVLIDMPVVVGALGLLPGIFVYTIVALGVALLSQCTITVERVSTGDEMEDEAEEAAA